MAHSSNSQDFPNYQPSYVQSKLKEERDREKQVQDVKVKMVTSLRKVVQVQSIQSQNVEQYSDAVCQLEPPVKEPFTERIYNGKKVRDVLMDTHDLINEPGGFMVNLSRHGQAGSTKLRIHLGIRKKPKLSANPSFGLISPGTITTTDDYARDIFRAIRENPQLEILIANLEINSDEDDYEQKVPSEMSSAFLQKLIQTYPMTLTKFHVEMPGISPMYLPEWKFLLDQQVCLKTLICNFGVVLWTFYQESIKRNSETLQKIILRRLQTYDITNARYCSFNWKIFAQCMNMTFLKVTCGYKFGNGLTVPYSPSTVFLHENIDSLPKRNIFEELHLGNIWVDPCMFESFCDSRPSLKICKFCNDLEYYDGDKDYMERDNANIQIISTSTFDLRAEYTASLPLASKTSFRRPREKQIACIVLTLFLVILMAISFLFVIVYFRHLRGEQQRNSLVVVSNTSSV